MGDKFSVLRVGQPISKLQVVLFKNDNFWEMIVWCYNSLGWVDVYYSQPSNMMALGYGILNVGVICDSAWSGAVPVAASSEGRSTGILGAVTVADSSSAGRGTGRLGAVAA